MDIAIESYEQADKILRGPSGHGFTHVVSINDTYSDRYPMRCDPPPAPKRHRGKHLVLWLDDAWEPDAVGRPPTVTQIRQIIDFAKAIPDDARVLVHCRGGVSRSSATALTIIACKREPSKETADRVVSDLLRIKRFIHPNQLMVWLADRELGWCGQLYEAYRMRFKAGASIWTPPEDVT